MLGLDMAYTRTTFDHYSFSRSKDMVDAHQDYNGSRDLTTLLSRKICYPRARICNEQPVYQIWSLYLCPLRKYKKDTKFEKWVGLQ